MAAVRPKIPTISLVGRVPEPNGLAA